MDASNVVGRELYCGVFPVLVKGYSPHDMRDRVRDNPRMNDEDRALQDILARVDARLGALGLSDREASRRAIPNNVDVVREMRKGRMPSVYRTMRLAAALECRLEWLLYGSGSETLPDEMIPASLAAEVSASVVEEVFSDAGIPVKVNGQIKDKLVSAFRKKSAR
ncbi:hypothetical protein [Magnetospirillum aberrantis]|uniref:Uncharacterized protein n=1 Tax=Magnetospirillum aberrantis SpK TaxID=908842 RepID=A0A7C9QTA2_9PROT|nr:hypothetical protein [Magnetospirillum aberrantis]NFV80025.1 hypothetical protein [Magnetospirillum aberrantis SpK]